MNGFTADDNFSIVSELSFICKKQKFSSAKRNEYSDNLPTQAKNEYNTDLEGNFTAHIGINPFAQVIHSQHPLFSTTALSSQYLNEFNMNNVQHTFTNSSSFVKRKHSEHGMNNNSISVQNRNFPVTNHNTHFSLENNTYVNDANNHQMMYCNPAITDFQQTETTINCSSSSKTTQMRDHWLTTPSLLQRAINTGDLPKIATIINERCIDECSFITSLISSEVTGKSHIIDFFRILLVVAPDSVMVMKRPRLEEQVFIFDFYFTGTKLFPHESEQFVFGSPTTSSPSAPDPLRRKIKKIVKTGGKPIVTYRGTILMQLDEMLYQAVSVAFKLKLSQVARAIVY